MLGAQYSEGRCRETKERRASENEGELAEERRIPQAAAEEGDNEEAVIPFTSASTSGGARLQRAAHQGRQVRCAGG